MNCLHCNSNCPENSKYCCFGCKTAHKFISENNLLNYYDYCKKIYNSSPRKIDDYENKVDYTQYINSSGDKHQIYLNIQGIHCGSCVWLIENTLQKESELTQAQVNLSTQRMTLSWQGNAKQIDKYTSIIQKLGFKAIPFVPDKIEEEENQTLSLILKMIAISGFATVATMMVLISIWSGNSTESITPNSRNMLHFLSMIVALPATLYSGQLFFNSAFLALSHGKLNMDVPISMSVIVALAISIFQTFTYCQHVYYDAALMLLFFLLIGRYLDHKVRSKARKQAKAIVFEQPQIATVINDGKTTILPVSKIKIGDIVIVAAGEKIPVDGRVIQGNSHIDQSIITGESNPVSIKENSNVVAGSLNLSNPIKVIADKTSDQTVLAEIIKLIELAEQKGSSYVRVADKIASYFTPIILFLALFTLTGWLYFTGDIQDGLVASAAVLIIACPCAVGLAVPVVQVIASTFLMQRGIMIKSADALEKVKQVDKIFFDKTGTLTIGKPTWVNANDFSMVELQIIKSMAMQSKHPFAKTINDKINIEKIDLQVEEEKGLGLKALHQNKVVKLGSRIFCDIKQHNDDKYLETWFCFDGVQKRLIFSDEIKADAAQTIHQLKKLGIKIALISGDRKSTTEEIANKLGIEDFRAELTPERKYEIINASKDDGYMTMMIGDGLNDSAAMKCADVAISPSNSVDLTANTADIVFFSDKLSPIVLINKVSTYSFKLILQNFVLSFIYNAITIPLAMLGFVTPVLAAVVMSSSSLLVVMNSMRLRWFDNE